MQRRQHTGRALRGERGPVGRTVQLGTVQPSTVQLGTVQLGDGDAGYSRRAAGLPG
ncbi:hypothetical protein [Angustibacter luteus]|uniref:Uncharacterized protein n=1 Tax=Angustibacter luteus TaxID=658456 RepID=A0ABW1JGC2_9ACTN